MFDNNPALTTAKAFKVDYAAVSHALALVGEFMASANCGVDAEAKLAIVVEELVANLLEHGNCPGDSEIRLELAALGADIGVTLCDAGTAFDPRAFDPDAYLPPERGGGAGIALVKAWASIIGYESGNGRNILRLVIREHG